MSTQSAVIGVNFGHSFSSIAAINQHGRADVIANEDGERQLATRIAFNEGQVYIGNQATPQLVRNANNVIDKFANLLGQSYSELSDSDKKRVSAPVVDNGGVPSFKVTIDGTEQTLSAHDVAVRYIRSLFLTAKDFLSGVPIAGAVVAAPLGYSAKQLAALKAAATEAGLIVLQIIPAAAAAVTAYGLTAPLEGGELPAHPDGVEAQSYAVGAELDRNVAVIDVGGSSTTVTVLAARAGVYSLLASVAESNLGGQQVDDALVAFFAKEFTKKTKVPIEASNARAWAKLRNEAEHTKRALSASASAQCAVESLAEGVDFSGSINRIRLDSLASPVYNKVIARTQEALKQANLDPCQVDEIILAGGSARLPGLTNSLLALFPEEGHTRITASIDADQVIARGCAVHASTIADTAEDAPERKFVLDLALSPASEISSLKAPATKRPIGLVLPEPKNANGVAASVVDGQVFVTLLPADTPLPARRAYTLPASAAGSVLLSFAEGTPDVKVEKIDVPRDEDDEDDEDLDDEEPEEKRTPIVKADSKRLAEVAYQASAKGDKVRVEIVAAVDGSVSIVVGEGDHKQEVKLPASA
ncbi:unnamed protein product [Parajaminaea phylloscopi]